MAARRPRAAHRRAARVEDRRRMEDGSPDVPRRRGAAVDAARDRHEARLHIDGRPISFDYFRREVWHPALELAGFETRAPYCLRHSYALHSLQAGVPNRDACPPVGSLQCQPGPTRRTAAGSVRWALTLQRSANPGPVAPIRHQATPSPAHRLGIRIPLPALSAPRRSRRLCFQPEGARTAPCEPFHTPGRPMWRLFAAAHSDGVASPKWTTGMSPACGIGVDVLNARLESV